MKKKLLTCLTLLLCVCSGAWADPVTIGLTQPVTNDGDTHTIGDASYTGVGTDVVVASSIGSQCGYGEYKSSGNYRTVKAGNPEVTYTAYKIFRKAEDKDNGSFNDDKYIGFTMTVAAGKKVTLTNLNAEFWSSDATMTWKVNVLNSTGTSIYETGTTQNNNYRTGSFSVAAPTGLTELKAGTYTIKLQMYLGAGAKYFVVPHLTFDATVEDDTTPTYTITANVAEGQSSYGSIDKAGDNIVVEGNSISLTATANEGYGFINWTDGNNDEVSTNETLTLNDVQADATYTANFKQVVQVKYSSNYRGTLANRQFVTYNAANGINEFYADGHDIYTIPTYAHHYYYREGYRFNKWAPTGDNENRLNSGDEYDVKNATITDNKITLNPSFTANTKTLAEALGSLSTETTVSWPLGVSSIVIRDWQTADAYGYYTQATDLDGEVFDIPMTITSNGKIANYTRTDALCQTNQNLKFTLPAVKGMVVTISGAYKAFKADGKTATTVAGSSDYTLSNSNKTLEYTYTGDASTIDIVMGNDAEYITTISVTYPQITRSVTIASSGWSSYSSDLPLDFANATDSENGKTLKAYALSSLTKSTATLTSVEKAPASTGLILKGKANETYTIPVCAAPAEVGTNKLVACVAAATVDANSVYVISGGGLKLFTGTDIPANKAYMPKTEVDNAAEAKVISFVFDGETTGIANLNVNENVNLDENAPMYNLAGQRVGKNYKGVVIQNGKKIIIK